MGRTCFCCAKHQPSFSKLICNLLFKSSMQADLLGHNHVIYLVLFVIGMFEQTLALDAVDSLLNPILGIKMVLKVFDPHFMIIACSTSNLGILVEVLNLHQIFQV